MAQQALLVHQASDESQPGTQAATVEVQRRQEASTTRPQAQGGLGPDSPNGPSPSTLRSGMHTSSQWPCQRQLPTPT